MAEFRTRAEVLAAARWRLPKLAPGQGVTFPLSPIQPGKRILYQALNAVAYQVFGAGRYRLTSKPGNGLQIVHLPEGMRRG